MSAGGNITVQDQASVNGHNVTMDAAGDVTVAVEHNVTATGLLTMSGDVLSADLEDAKLGAAAFTGTSGNVNLINAKVAGTITSTAKL